MRTVKLHKTLTIFFLFLIGVVNYLDRSALSIANTTIQKDLAISPMQMGVMLSTTFSIAYAFSQLPLGALIDKLGSKLALSRVDRWWCGRLRRRPSACSAAMAIWSACGCCWG